MPLGSRVSGSKSRLTIFCGKGLKFFDFLLFLGIVQEFLNRPSQDRMDEMSIDLSQRDKDEFAVLDAMVGNFELPRLNLNFIEKKDVQVNRSRSPSKGFRAAQVGFDGLQDSQEFGGI